MKIIKGIHNWRKIKKPVVIAMGVFDGVHLGHQKVVQESLDLAKKINGVAYVVTFDMHPRTLIYPDKKIEILTTQEEKIKLFESMGVDGVLILNFNEHTAKMSAESFFENELINQLGVKGVVVGENFKFGSKQRGDVKFLKKYSKIFDCSAKAVRSKKYKNEVISSTNIRKHLVSGDVEYINKCLNRDYSVEGKVVKGLSIGGKYGVPTLNVHIPIGKAVPRGVFAGYVKFGSKEYKVVINAGTRPSIERACGKFCLEAHILNFSKDIYGKHVRIYFKKKLRDEKKFKNIDLLFKQIREDIENAGGV